jgi:hypothetical protein
MTWRATGWSPFGLGFRRATERDTQPLPIPTRAVRAAWMPPGAAIELLTGPADTLGPSLWIVPRGGGVVDAPAADSVLRGAGGWATLRHPLGLRRVTAVRVIAPDAAAVPPAAGDLEALAGVRFRTGAAWLLEVTFDGGAWGRTSDLRPTLPLVLRY